MKPISQKRFQVKDIKLNVAEVGSGPSLVMIHGWSNSWIGWTPLALELASKYHLHMIDMAGFGDSDRLPKYSLDIQAVYISQFIQNQHLQPKAIIGASLGSLVVPNLVQKHPHLTDNIILIGAMFTKLSIGQAKDLYIRLLKLAHKHHLTEQIIGKAVKTRYAAYIIEKYFNNAYAFDPQKVDKFNLPGRKKMDEKCYVEMGISGFNFNLEKFLKTTKKKCLIIYGENERYVTPQHAEKILLSLNNPRISLKIIPKSGHNPAYENPRFTAKVIERFLS